jgi:hypothetical protein
MPRVLTDMRRRMECGCCLVWSEFSLLRLAPVSSYQVALVFVHARGVVGVEVGLQRVVRFHGVDGVGARGRGALDGDGRHVGRMVSCQDGDEERDDQGWCRLEEECSREQCVSLKKVRHSLNVERAGRGRSTSRHAICVLTD